LGDLEEWVPAVAGKSGGKERFMEFKKSMSQKLRMDGRDYSRPGWYFVTLGADYHKILFGVVKNCEMVPNALGELVERCWRGIPTHYDHIELGAWQVMPNHFHGLVRIARAGGAGLGEVLNVFKGAVTREWRRQEVSRNCGKEHGVKERIWAPNYWDVICFEPEQLEVREKYVRENPRRWALKDVLQGRIKQSCYKGNKALLNETGVRRALRVSRGASEVDVAALQEELSSFDGVVCSTFFSPGERACLKSLQAGSARIVWVLPMAMPEHISVDWTNAFLEQRALWLSAFPDEQSDATRESCQRANLWVEKFCQADRSTV